MSEMICELFERYPVLEAARGDIEAALSAMVDCFRAGGKLLTAGNGGSAADAGHIAGELLKSFRRKRPLPDAERQAFAAAYGEEGEALACRLEGGLPVIALPDQTATLTAIGNDIGEALGFAQLTYAYGRAGDLLIALSTSGNSKNLVNAARVAHMRGMRVIALVGEGDAALDALADIAIHAPAAETAFVQELHLPIYHALCAACEEILFP